MADLTAHSLASSSRAISEAYLALRQQLHFDPEIAELRASAVAPHRIIALYPLDVRDVTGWLFDSVGEDPDLISKFSEEVVGTTSVTSVHGRAKFEVGPTSLNNDHRVAFYEDGYAELMSSPAGKRWGYTEEEPSRPYSSWSQKIVAELLWIGVHWGELDELHGWEKAHVDDLLLLAKLVGEAKARNLELAATPS